MNLGLCALCKTDVYIVLQDYRKELSKRVKSRALIMAGNTIQKGEVIHVPSEGPSTRSRCAKTYNAIEKDQYIYLQIEKPNNFEIEPFKMPCFQQKGYSTIRLQNIFENSVTNCAENFLDIPHTTYVHPTIFRNSNNTMMSAQVERKKGTCQSDIFKWKVRLWNI